jgi:hypothetical protein
MNESSRENLHRYPICPHSIPCTLPPSPRRFMASSMLSLRVPLRSVSLTASSRRDLSLVLCLVPQPISQKTQVRVGVQFRDYNSDNL